jgi:hypothetical protein
MVPVFGKRFGMDDDIVKVDIDVNAQHWFKNLIHNVLEMGRAVLSIA